MTLIFTYTSMHYHAILPMCHLMYIVGSGLPPSSYQSWLLCVYQTKLYPPSSSILTVPLTYPNRLILHISRIYYYLYHCEPLNRWQGSWYAKYWSFRWLIKLYFVCIHIICIVEMNGEPCTTLAKKHTSEANIHIYRSEVVMAAPLQSYCDDTMHVDWVVYFYFIGGCSVFEVALWANHDASNKSSPRIA